LFPAVSHATFTHATFSCRTATVPRCVRRYLSLSLSLSFGESRRGTIGRASRAEESNRVRANRAARKVEESLGEISPFLRASDSGCTLLICSHRRRSRLVRERVSKYPTKDSRDSAVARASFHWKANEIVLGRKLALVTLVCGLAVFSNRGLQFY